MIYLRIGTHAPPVNMQKACAKVLRHMSFQCVRNVRRGAGGRIPGWYLRIGLSYVRTSSWPQSTPILSAYWINALHVWIENCAPCLIRSYIPEPLHSLHAAVTVTAACNFIVSL